MNYRVALSCLFVFNEYEDCKSRASFFVYGKKSKNLFSIICVFILLSIQLHQPVSANEEVFHNKDYFYAYSSYRYGVLFKNIIGNLFRSYFLHNNNKDSLHSCRELVSCMPFWPMYLYSRPPLIYIGKQRYNNLTMLYYGIRSLPRTAYVEALVGSRSSHDFVIRYDGYQMTQNSSERMFLWNTYEISPYQLYDKKTPTIVSASSVSEVGKILAGYLGTKGYEFAHLRYDMQRDAKQGTPVFIFKQDLHWSICIRLIFKSGVFSRMQIGFKKDFLPPVF